MKVERRLCCRQGLHPLHTDTGPNIRARCRGRAESKFCKMNELCKFYINTIIFGEN